MAKKYKPAVFQPTIRPSWSGSLEYIGSDELAQILKAITAFPNLDVPNSAFWNQTVKPDLEQQFASFNETCESRGRGARTYWGEHKLSLCSTYDNHKDTASITQGNLCKDKDKNKDKDENEYKDILNSIADIKNNRFITELTLFKAGFQGWVFPPEIRKVATQHWSADEIRNIEKDFSCHEYETETSISDLLQTYPPKPKKKSYGEQQKVKLTDEEYTKLQELYGRRLENAIQILDGYLAENTKNEKKYTSHYAVMRRNNWVYNKTFDGDFVPLKPQIADMSKFVRAKPLGEEND